MKPAPGRVDSFGVKRIACIAVSSARWYFYVTFQVLTLRIIKCYRLKHGENHRVTHGVNLQLTRFVFASSKNIKFVFGASTASLQRKHEFTRLQLGVTVHQFMLISICQCLCHIMIVSWSHGFIGLVVSVVS